MMTWMELTIEKNPGSSPAVHDERFPPNGEGKKKRKKKKRGKRITTPTGISQGILCWNGMAFFSPSSFKKPALSLSLISIFVFFLVAPQPPSSLFSSELHHRRSLLLNSTSSSSCPPSSSSSTAGSDNGIIDYLSLHHCLFHGNPFLSIPSLSLFLLLHFYILIKTAQDHFSVVTTKLAFHLNLSPSMAAVTLLALGNGAPDVFASVAALRGGQYRTGLGAILSAGTFVSALVVGFVAIYAAPFSVDPAPFVRDVLFYLIAALSLFYVYLSAEIFLWQAIGFVGFYLFFVGFVFYMDLGMGGRRGMGANAGISAGDFEGEKLPVTADRGADVSGTPGERIHGSGFRRAFKMVSRILPEFKRNASLNMFVFIIHLSEFHSWPL